ncbi:MAG: hypothetical protein KDA79_01795 [Planctomycetaceae bacterium]|nr:hypothetical protein [Planctomycetaceae bacterium]
MTSVSKILAVVTAVFSLAFMGFALVTWATGPNWGLAADEVESYAFERTSGENPTWSATHRISGESAGSPAPQLAKVIIDARRKIQTVQQDELQEINTEIALLGPRIAELQRTKQEDTEALKRQEKALVEQIDQITEEIQNQARQADALAGQSRDVRITAEKRREDVYRLRNDLSLVRAELYRTEQQSISLKDRLNRLEGKVRRLERRNRQLAEQL